MSSMSLSVVGIEAWGYVSKGALNRIMITVLKESWPVLFLINYFVKHFNVSRSEVMASSEKPAVTSWISWGNGVRATAIGIRSWVAQSVVRYVDVIGRTKSGSVVVAVIHCGMMILILSELNRIISIDVVKREQESFTGWRVTARTWKEHKSLITLTVSVKTETISYKGPFWQNIYSNKNKYSTRGSDLLADHLICVTRDKVVFNCDSK